MRRSRGGVEPLQLAVLLLYQPLQISLLLLFQGSLGCTRLFWGYLGLFVWCIGLFGESSGLFPFIGLVRRYSGLFSQILGCT